MSYVDLKEWRVTERNGRATSVRADMLRFEDNALVFYVEQRWGWRRAHWFQAELVSNVVELSLRGSED